MVASIRSNNKPPIPASRVLGLASSKQVQYVKVTTLGVVDFDLRSSVVIDSSGDSTSVPRHGYAPILCHSSSWTLICIARASLGF